MNLSINIGAGSTWIPGFVNVDRSERADVVVDLELGTLPFGTGVADLVFSYHTLEHIKNYLGLLAEIHRVLAPGGWLLLQVPYATCTERNLVNPYHHQLFNEFSFDFFDPTAMRRRPAGCVTFRKVFHDFEYCADYPASNKLPEEREFDRRHVLNVVQTISFGLVAWKGGAPPGVGDELRGAQRARLAECIAARRDYDDEGAR